MRHILFLQPNTLYRLPKYGAGGHAHAYLDALYVSANGKRYTWSLKALRKFQVPIGGGKTYGQDFAHFTGYETRLWESAYLPVVLL